MGQLVAVNVSAVDVVGMLGNVSIVARGLGVHLGGAFLVLDEWPAGLLYFLALVQRTQPRDCSQRCEALSASLQVTGSGTELQSPESSKLVAAGSSPAGGAKTGSDLR